MLATHPRTEYLTEPIAIDTLEPRFTWEPQAEGRARRQSAYRILVASERKLLRPGKADLWDSGRVESGETLHIAYAGQPLRAGGSYCWKVRIWDENGKAQGWSKPASFGVGLLDASQWKASWIGMTPPPVAPLSYDGCAWLWGPEKPAEGEPLPQQRWLRRRLRVTRLNRIVRARMLLTVDNEFKGYVNGIKVTQPSWQGDCWKFNAPVDVLPFLQAGDNVFAVAASKVRDGSAGAIGRVMVEYDDGKVRDYPLDRRWRIADQEPDPAWHDPEFDDSEWAKPVKVASYGGKPWGKLALLDLDHQFSPCLRKGFELHKPVARAVLHATALGVFDLYMNGSRVNEEFFSPGWTDYPQRLHLMSWDVTRPLRKGANAIGAMLASGWFCGNLAWAYNSYYGSRPYFAAQLEVEYADGTTETIVTDDSWRAHEGPLGQADMLMGEHRDGRREIRGWSKARFDDAEWAPVSLEAPPVEPEIKPHPGNPVRVTQTLRPVEVTEPEPGVFVFDMGQNMVGTVRMRARGPRGQQVILRYGEMLNPDGTLHTTNMRRARNTDTYCLRGGSKREEVFEPRFVFHGFRYVEVRGYPGKPDAEAIQGLVLHSDMPRTLEFDSSNAMLNQLVSNIGWGQRGNYLEIPTDCPQRDERLGWTGDAQAFVKTATFLCEVGAFYKKWLRDLEDGQREDGAVPDIAPYIRGLGFGTAAWGDAMVICPYMVWRAYGDTRLLEEHWDAMCAMLTFYEESSADLIRPNEGYGDWLSIEAETSRSLIGTAYFAWDAALMVELAEALGREQDAQRFRALSERVKAAFNRRFVNADGSIESDTQTAYILALKFGLLDEALAAEAARRLVADIEARGNLLSVGFVGISYMNPVLTSIGRDDLAWSLLLETRFPSWGYEIVNGATTIWERWNSWTAETGFGDKTMNSFNHYAFGSIGEWIFERVNGIANTGDAYRRIEVRPRPGGGVDWATLRYDSIRGPIECNWRLKGDGLTLEVEAPANTTARIELPTLDADGATENGAPLAEAEGVEVIETGAESVVLEVGSGRYKFATASVPAWVRESAQPTEMV